MKVYRVVTERDGKTIKEPGITSTERLREEWRYAAETMQQVWDRIQWVRDDPERDLLALIEEHPQIDVIAAEQPPSQEAAPVGAGVRQDDEVHQGGAPATTLPLKD